MVAIGQFDIDVFDVGGLISPDQHVQGLFINRGIGRSSIDQHLDPSVTFDVAGHIVGRCPFVSQWYGVVELPSGADRGI